MPSFPRRLRCVVRRVHGRASTVAAYGADSSPVDPLMGYGDRPDGMSLTLARMESLPSSQIDSRSLSYPAQAAPTSVDPPSASIPRPTCLLCGAGSSGLQPHEPVHVRARVQDPQQRKRRSRRLRGGRHHTVASPTIVAPGLDHQPGALPGRQQSTCVLGSGSEPN